MITPRMLEVYRFIEEYQGKHVYAPSYSEICAALDIKSKGNVARLISSMEERGCLQRIAGKSRAIRLLPLDK